MAPWRVALGIAVVVVLAVVTGTVLMSSFGDDPSAAGTPIAVPPTATATATPTADPDPMPELHHTGEDFDQIIRSIEAFRSWLYRNPSPELASRIYHSECDCHAELVDRLTRLSEAGYYVAEGGAAVREVLVLDSDGDVVALKVVDESLPTVVRDVATDRLIDEDEGSGPNAFRVLLKREDGRWYVRDIDKAALDLSVSA